MNLSTPLMIAAKSGFTDVIKALVQRGADVNVKSSANGMTALHFAANFGQVEAVKELLSLNADVNIQMEHQQTGLTFYLCASHS